MIGKRFFDFQVIKDFIVAACYIVERNVETMLQVLSSFPFVVGRNVKKDIRMQSRGVVFTIFYDKVVVENIDGFGSCKRSARCTNKCASETPVFS